MREGSGKREVGKGIEGTSKEVRGDGKGEQQCNPQQLGILGII